MLLLFQGVWNAPLLLRDGADANEMALAVQSGDILHRILGVLLGVSGLIWCRFHTRNPLRWQQPLGWIFLAWTLWLGASFWWSEDPGLTLRRLTLLFFLLVSAAAFSRLTRASIFTLVAFGAVRVC